RERRDGSHIRVVQISRADTASALAASGFSRTWAALGGSRIVDRRLADSDVLTPVVLSRVVRVERPDVLVLWLDADQVRSTAALVDHPQQPGMLILSGSILGDRLDAVPVVVRPLARVTYPYSVPGTSSPSAVDLTRWLAMRGLPAIHLRIRSQMYALGWILAGAVASMGGDFYRERLIDAFDTTADQDFTAAGYPRLSFGYGQRYALKGCYVVRLRGDATVRPEAVTDWLVD